METSCILLVLIRKFIGAIGEGRDEAIVRGTGKHTRGFLYVEDVLEGILLAAECYNKNEPVNLGSNLEISIKGLTGLITGLQDLKERLIGIALSRMANPKEDWILLWLSENLALRQGWILMKD